MSLYFTLCMRLSSYTFHAARSVVTQSNNISQEVLQNTTGNILLCPVNLQSVPIKHTAREGHMMGPCRSQPRPDVNVMFRCMLPCLHSLLSCNRRLMHANA